MNLLSVLLICSVLLLSLTISQSQDVKLIKLNTLKCSAPARQRILTLLRPQNEIVSKGDYPWHAAIFMINDIKTKYFCGGTLISSDTVLTAAHCLLEDSNKKSVDTLKVRFGITRLYFDGETHEVFKIIPHSSFNDHSFRHDIGLIRLKKTVEFTDYIRPACLTNENFNIINVDGFITGFGSLTSLNMAVMPARSASDCENTNGIFYLTYQDPDHSFCAGHLNGTTLSEGDSGGGLIFEHSDGWYVRGIASMTAGTFKRKKEVDITKFALFVDVQSHFQWIVDNMGIVEDTIIIPQNFCPAPAGVVIDYYSMARNGSYPWQCTIFLTHQQFGGTIIGEDIIITLNSTPLSKALLDEIIIKVGARQLQGETSFYKAKSIKVHNEMKFPKQLVLIRLERKLVYSNQVKPVCFTNNNFQHFDITEWIPGFSQGQTTDNGVVVTGMNNFKCTMGSIVKDSNIYCADVARIGIILRGTGLVYNFRNGLYIRGIYMAVIGYKFMNFDGSQIMDVVPYYDWIQKTIKELS